MYLGFSLLDSVIQSSKRSMNFCGKAVKSTSKPCWTFSLRKGGCREEGGETLKPDDYSLAANTHTVTYKESHSNSFSERRNINDSTPALALFTRVSIIWRCPVHTWSTHMYYWVWTHPWKSASPSDRLNKKKGSLSSVTLTISSCTWN